MRPLNPSEKRLSILFALLLFGWLNWAVGTRLWQGFQTVRQEKEELANTVAQLETLLGEKPAWDQRMAWLDENQPVMNSPRDAGLQLLETLKKEATKAGLEILEREVGEAEQQPFASQVTAKMKTTGNLQAMSQWIHALQQPDKFHAITFLDFVADSQDPEKLTCQLHLACWYQPSES